jgi:hypothetical protein
VGMPHQQQVYLCRYRNVLSVSVQMLLDITQALPCALWAGYVPSLSLAVCTYVLSCR